MEKISWTESSRRSSCVVYGNVQCLHNSLSEMSLIARGEDVFFFCSETLVSYKLNNSEIMVPGFSRPKQLLKGDVDRF